MVLPEAQASEGNPTPLRGATDIGSLAHRRRFQESIPFRATLTTSKPDLGDHSPIVVPWLAAIGNQKPLDIQTGHLAHFPKGLMGKDQERPGDLLQGTLDMLILKTLARRPLHGYGVAELIHQRSEDVLRVEEGALYPAPHRLELRGLLASAWGMSENNRRAKYYRLTAAGRRYLESQSAHWNRLVAAIERVMETA